MFPIISFFLFEFEIKTPSTIFLNFAFVFIVQQVFVLRDIEFCFVDVIGIIKYVCQVSRYRHTITTRPRISISIGEIRITHFSFRPWTVLSSLSLRLSLFLSLLVFVVTIRKDAVARIRTRTGRMCWTGH